jgi:hypothetical protein
MNALQSFQGLTWTRSCGIGLHGRVQNSDRQTDLIGAFGFTSLVEVLVKLVQPLSGSEIAQRLPMKVRFVFS